MHTTSIFGSRSFCIGKLDFPKFNDEDVVGWIYRCNHYFKVDVVPDELKVDLATIHLDGDALLWHQSYMKMKDVQGATVSWEEYSIFVNSRFGLSPFDDPILDLKNLKQSGTSSEYYHSFTSLFHHVQLLDPMTERHALSYFLGGLKLDLQAPV